MRESVVEELDAIKIELDTLSKRVGAAIKRKPALLTTEEAADYCGLSEAYMLKLRRGVDGPAYIKIGENVRYHIGDLNTWIRGKERRGTV